MQAAVMYSQPVMPMAMPTGSPLISMDMMDVESGNYGERQEGMQIENPTSIQSLGSIESSGSVSKYLNF